MWKETVNCSAMDFIVCPLAKGTENGRFPLGEVVFLCEVSAFVLERRGAGGRRSMGEASVEEPEYQHEQGDHEKDQGEHQSRGRVEGKTVTRISLARRDAKNRNAARRKPRQAGFPTALANVPGRKNMSPPRRNAAVLRRKAMRCKPLSGKG